MLSFELIHALAASFVMPAARLALTASPRATAAPCALRMNSKPPFTYDGISGTADTYMPYDNGRYMQGGQYPQYGNARYMQGQFSPYGNDRYMQGQFSPYGNDRYMQGQFSPYGNGRHMQGGPRSMRNRMYDDGFEGGFMQNQFSPYGGNGRYMQGGYNGRMHSAQDRQAMRMGYCQPDDMCFGMME